MLIILKTNGRVGSFWNRLFSKIKNKHQQLIEDFKIMKTFRNSQKSIAAALLIIFSSYFFTSCYTLESSTKLSTERIPHTEAKTGNKKYTYETTKKPNVDDPDVKLKMTVADEYKVSTKSKYKYEYRNRADDPFFKATGYTPGLLIGTVGMGGAAGSLLMFAFGGIEGNNDYILAGGIMIGISTVLFFLGWFTHEIHYSMPETKTKYKYKSSPEVVYFYKNPIPLSNSNIAITQSNITKTFHTNHNGSLRINLVNDFNLIGSKNNYKVTFTLKTNNVHFDKPLELLPSLWQYKYAKIDVPECNIRLRNSSYSNILGTARQGMEYKILSEQDYNFKIELVNKSGWIKSTCAETFYSIPKKKDISIVIKKYVEEKMNIWQKQSEFEGKDDYLNRILKRNQKAEEMIQQALDMFQQDYARLIDWNNSKISRYDPNNQTFKIDIPALDPIIISVPLINDVARSFKENWERARFKNQQFTIVDGKWELKSLDIHNPLTNHTVHYNSAALKHYNPLTGITIELETIDIDITTRTATTEDETKILDPGYSISINLPKTKMSNPDAIAVVIGNSSYDYTDSVNFAINDAQLMKSYLTNVIGFKLGNIIFERNAEKGQFDVLFGKKGDHKGKLFNYVKPGISDVFVFYSGHGATGINDKKAYFVPSNCEPKYVELQGYPFDLFYKNLSKIPAKSTTIILDACFSGAGVDISGRPIIEPLDTIQIKNSVIITSSTGIEVSSWYKAKRHGIFTYFFLKAIHDHKNSDKNPKDSKLTFQEIYDYLSDDSEGVPYYAKRLNAIQQHPTIIGNAKDRVFVEY